jgi:hypothetical protein
MNISIHSTKNEKQIRSSIVAVTGSDGERWISIDFNIKWDNVRDEISFFLPISDEATVRQISKLWNTLSVAAKSAGKE